jgi:acylphosphatase
MASVKRAHLFYTGRVQGVGFRYMVREIACGYDVTGFVRNLADGRVELVGEGCETELQAFLEAIRVSQLSSHIRHADAAWSDGTGQFKGFEISR